jgi:hypothetical protein
MKYLIKGGRYQDLYNEYKSIKKMDKSIARHVAFEHIRYIMQDMVVFKSDSLIDKKTGDVNNTTKDRLKFIQAYGIPKVKAIYDGIIAPQPHDLGRIELVEAFDYLFKNKDDDRKVTYHKQFPNGFKIN